MTRFSLFAPLALLVLAACQTPLEQCLSDAARPATELREELAERRANLTRGYRIERESMPVMVMTTCYRQGRLGVVRPYPCSEWVNEVQNRRVPIDAQVESERIALLERQLARAEAQEAQALRNCRASFPAT